MTFKNIQSYFQQLCFLMPCLFMAIGGTAAQNRHCLEQLPPGACLYDMESSLEDNFRFTLKLDSTDLRNPPVAGLASALEHLELLTDVQVARRLTAVTREIHQQLLQLESANKLCASLRLSISHTQLLQKKSGELAGQIAFAKTDMLDCYEKSPYGHIVFQFQVSTDSFKVTPPERLARYFMKNPERRVSAEDLARKAGVFPRDAVLKVHYGKTNQKRPIVCLNCASFPNAVYVDMEDETVGTPFGIDSIGLYHLLQQVNDTSFAIEAKVLATGEYVSEEGYVQYADLQVLASHKDLTASSDAIRISGPVPKKRRYYFDRYGNIETGQVVFAVLAKLPSQPNHSPPATSSYTAYRYIDCLPLSSVASDLDTWKGVRNQLSLKQRSTSTLGATLFAQHRTDNNLIDLRITPSIEDGVSYDFNFQKIIKYDTTRLGSNIVLNQKLTGPNGERIPKSGQALTFISTTSGQDFSHAKKPPVEYNIEVYDIAPNAVSVHIRPSSSQPNPMVYDTHVKGDWNASSKLSSTSPIISLHISAKGLATGDILSFQQDGSEEKTTVTLRELPKNKFATIDRVSSTEYSSGDTLIFYGKNLLEKRAVFYVPCEIGDPEVPLRGHCNIQGWHQRGQPHTNTQIGYIVPKTYSHGMNRRTDLIPRSGEVLIRNSSNRYNSTGIFINVKD